MTAHQKVGIDPALERLATLLELARKARQAADAAELEFIVVNDTHSLSPYRQAALWSRDRGIVALSGLVEVEANAPYAHWLVALARGLAAEQAAPATLTAADAPPALAGDWREWLGGHAAWLPIRSEGGEVVSALILSRDFEWDERELRLLAEWLETWDYAYAGRSGPAKLPLAARVRAFLTAGEPGAAWYKRPAAKWGLGVLLLLLLPVRLSVLAPGELVPHRPATLRAANDGVIDTILVRPNQHVRKGQPLFRIDTALTASRRDAALEALAAAEAEYRQTLQRALTDDTAKSQLAAIAGKIEEQRAEASYLEEQFRRSTTTAPRDGVVLFDDPSELIGRPVATGERVMRIADPSDTEVEAWVNIGDAIPLREGATVKLYLDARPLSPVAAELRYFSHEATERPDGSYAYRVRARLTEGTDAQVGLKGTAKLNGGWVPLAYWVLRRPLATVRATIGF